MILRLFGAFMLMAGVARAEVPAVATDIAPVHALVARVMQGAGTPELIMRPGASPHGYALRPSEAAALEQADLVIWMGDALTPWLSRALQTLAGDARRLSLLEAEATRVLPLRDGVAFDQDDHGHAHDHGHDHGHATGLDPHAWLDPANAQVWLPLIAAELAALDPENGALYRQNAAEAQAEMTDLMEELHAVLSPAKGLPFLVFHDAYQYFEARFGLHVAAAVSLSDASEPGPARLSALRALVADRAIVCAFAEPQFNPRLIDTVFEGRVATAQLDPMGSNLAPGPALYSGLLRQMAQNIAACATR